MTVKLYCWIVLDKQTPWTIVPWWFVVRTWQKSSLFDWKGSWILVVLSFLQKPVLVKMTAAVTPYKSCPPVLVQRPAVELPGKLCAELWLIPVLYWVCGQLLAIKARLDHQTEPGTLWEVTTLGRKDSGLHSSWALAVSKLVNDHRSWVKCLIPIYCLWEWFRNRYIIFKQLVSRRKPIWRAKTQKEDLKKSLLWFTIKSLFICKDLHCEILYN